MEYKETGNKIPLQVDELSSYVMDKLKQFDALVKTTGGKPEQNPYNDPIIYITSEGKTVQIPTEIQRNAVNQWNDMKNPSNQQNDMYDDQIVEELPYEDIKSTKDRTIQTKEQNEPKNYYNLLFYVILAILAAYFLFKK